MLSHELRVSATRCEVNSINAVSASSTQLSFMSFHSFALSGDKQKYAPEWDATRAVRIHTCGVWLSRDPLGLHPLPVG